MAASGPVRTILFLISDTGAGHRSAANAITAALRELPSQSAPDAPPWRAVIVDAFAEGGRFPLRNGVFLYGPATKYSPQLYGRIFHMTNTPARFNTAWRLCKPFLYQGLRSLIERVQPDVIVSVHPLLNHITVRVVLTMGLRIPVLTVVTDLETIHCSWIAPGVTACMVPTPTARRTAIAGGIPARRVRLVGMPIDPAFSALAATPREVVRARLGLAADLPVVLLVGGGEGSTGLAEAARTLSHADLHAQLLVVTGRNRLLREELERQRPSFRMPVQVHGFVQNMPELMRAADLIVTKAGPGTIAEAIASGLPILLTGAIPGQEEGNLDYVLENDLGVLVRDPEELERRVRELVTPGNAEFRRLQRNVRAQSRPQASFDIAEVILSHLPPPQAASVWETERPRAHRPLVHLLRNPRYGARRMAWTLRRVRGRHGLARW